MLRKTQGFSGKCRSVLRRRTTLELLANSTWVSWVGVALIGGALFLLGRVLQSEEDSRAAAEALSDSSQRTSTHAFIRKVRPLLNQYFVPIVRGKGTWENTRRKAKRDLISAGLRDELTPDEFIALKFFLVLFFPVTAAVLKALDLVDAGPLLIAGASVAGWFYPDFWAKGRMQRRQTEILKAMPFVVDLLALSTEAGLDFIGAIGRVVEKSKGNPLVEEFEQVLREIRVGSSRQDALREMGQRINMTEVNSFIAILISADQMGAPIGRVLRQQSEQIRAERMLRAEKAGAAAAQKLLLPIFLFVFPAVLMMVIGPLVLGMIYGGKT